MAHFAEINSENKVLRVLVVPNDQEHRGSDYLSQDLGLGGTWLQTSYNTVGNKHLLGGVPFRKNYAGVGYIYDPVRDAFIPPKSLPSLVFDEDTCTWKTPVPPPEDGFQYYWDEETVAWVRIPEPPNDGKKYRFDAFKKEWVKLNIKNESAKPTVQQSPP